MKKSYISDAVIRRLPRYYRYLDDLHNKGFVRISSGVLGEKMGITASQIRQDLSCFGEFGQQGYGYNIQELRKEVGHILGVDCNHSAIVVGVGNIGHALMNHFHFREAGFRLLAAFDVSQEVVGKAVAGVPVLPLSDMENFVREHCPDVAVLTVPQAAAQATADRLISLGVRGFWNFTNLELDLPPQGVSCENVHFSDSLLTLSYWITPRE